MMERTTNSEFRMFVRDEGEEDRLWFVNGKSAQTKDWKRGLVEVVRADASKCYQVKLIECRFLPEAYKCKTP